MINAVITFIITLAVIYFVFVVPMNKWRARKGEDSVDVTPADVQLLEEIRDLLKQQRQSRPWWGGTSASRRASELPKPPASSVVTSGSSVVHQRPRSGILKTRSRPVTRRWPKRCCSTDRA